jgi:hypothetical protein
LSPEERQEQEDVAWLLARARGEAVEHPDPARAAAYARLERSLAALEAPRPSEGWQDAVLGAIDARARARRRAYYLFAFAAALVLLAWGAWPQPVEGAFGPVAIRAGHLPGGEAYRGGPPSLSRGGADERPGDAPGSPVEGGRPPAREERPGPGGETARASLGDAVAFEAWLSGPGEVRVYRDGGQLVLRCPGADGCLEARELRRRLLKVDVTLRAPGRYRAVLLSGASLPAPAPSEQEREGLRAAAAAGARVVDSIFVEVR